MRSIRNFIIDKGPKRAKKSNGGQVSLNFSVICHFVNLSADEQLLLNVQTFISGKMLPFSTGFIHSVSTQIQMKTSTVEVPKELKSHDWISDKLTDFTFVVDGARFNVHKNVCSGK